MWCILGGMVCTFFSRIRVAHLLFHRAHIEILVKTVSESKYKGFCMFAKAYQYYLAKKGSGQVRLIRDPGDDIIFGPLSEAVQ